MVQESLLLRKIDRFGIHIDYFEEKVPLGNAGALFKIKERLDDDFLLLNANAMFDVDLTDLSSFIGHTAA